MKNFLSFLDNKTFIKDLSSQDLIKIARDIPNFVEQTVKRFDLNNKIEDLSVVVKNTTNPKLENYLKKFNLINSEQKGMRGLAVIEMLRACNQCCLDAPIKDTNKFDNLTKFSISYGNIPGTHFSIDLNFLRKLGEQSFESVPQFLSQNLVNNAVKSLSYRDQIDLKTVGDFKLYLMKREFFVQQFKQLYQLPKTQNYAQGCQLRYGEQLRLNYSDFVQPLSQTVKDLENSQEKIFAKVLKPIDLANFNSDIFSAVKTSKGEEVLMFDQSKLTEIADVLREQQQGNNVEFYRSDEQILNHQACNLKSLEKDSNKQQLVTNLQNRLKEINKNSLDMKDLSIYGKKIKALLKEHFPDETFVFKKNIDPKNTYLEITYSNPLLQNQLDDVYVEAFGRVQYEKINFEFNKDLAKKEIELAETFGKKLSYGNTGLKLYVKNDFKSFKSKTFDLLYELTEKKENSLQTYKIDDNVFYQVPINSNLAQKETFEKFKELLSTENVQVYLSAADSIVEKPLAQNQIKNLLSDLEQSFGHEVTHTQQNVKGLSR